MKKYQTKPEFVEAVQYDGTWASLDELKKINPYSITCDNNNHYFNNIRLTKDCWIVKQVDIVETSEAGETVYEFIVMRDDQFANKYITSRDIDPFD